MHQLEFKQHCGHRYFVSLTLSEHGRRAHFFYFYTFQHEASSLGGFRFDLCIDDFDLTR